MGKGSLIPLLPHSICVPKVIDDLSVGKIFSVGVEVCIRERSNITQLGCIGGAYSYHNNASGVYALLHRASGRKQARLERAFTLKNFPECIACCVTIQRDSMTSKTNVSHFVLVRYMMG